MNSINFDSDFGGPLKVLITHRDGYSWIIHCNELIQAIAIDHRYFPNEVGATYQTITDEDYMTRF